MSNNETNNAITVDDVTGADYPKHRDQEMEKFLNVVINFTEQAQKKKIEDLVAQVPEAETLNAALIGLRRNINDSIAELQKDMEMVLDEMTTVAVSFAYGMKEELKRTQDRLQTTNGQGAKDYAKITELENKVALLTEENRRHRENEELRNRLAVLEATVARIIPTTGETTVEETKTEASTTN